MSRLPSLWRSPAALGLCFSWFTSRGDRLFGLLNYPVARRTTEIGIRTALDARQGELVLPVAKALAAMVGADCGRAPLANFGTHEGTPGGQLAISANRVLRS
ncbi:MAG TPA: hypothetical protein VK604_14360 [Bryobacteraceae bacterium]|nr:hypothetical protein [Bryobacteraceae bacterium]